MMNERFELFVTTVTKAYKYIQQIKKYENGTFGVKGIHIMCLFFLGQNPQGLTVTELSALSCEDKAATSRTVAHLLEKGLAYYEIDDSSKRRWRSKLLLTDKGKEAVSKLDVVIEEAVSGIRDGLDVEELKCFYKIFNTINDRLGDYCDGLEKSKKK